MQNQTPVLVLLVGLLSAPACVVDVDDDHRHWAAGDLFVDWTIDDVKDPRDCARFDADAISIVIETRFGRYFDRHTRDCEDFDTRIALPPGDYRGHAELTDVFGAAVTTSIELEPFSIHFDDDAYAPINFPLDSFLP